MSVDKLQISAGSDYYMKNQLSTASTGIDSAEKVPEGKWLHPCRTIPLPATLAWQDSHFITLAQHHFSLV